MNAVGAQLAKFFHLGSADRLRYWLGTLGRFASVQVVMQALNAVTGFLILRQFTKPDYALYTIVNTMQGTMSILADAGIGVALSAVGGKVWQDRRRLGELVNTALRTRWRMAGVVSVVISPLLGWMLWRNGAGLGYGAALMAVVLVGLYFQLSQDVYIIVPRLHSQMERVMRNNLCVALVRLAFTAAMLSIFFNALVAVAMAAAVAAYQNMKMAGWSAEHADPAAPANPSDQKEIARKIRHLMPSAIFYCLEGQLLILLISLTGRSDHVADVGALGRLAVIFDLFSSLLVNLALPAFTRCHNPALLKKRYGQILGGYFCLGAAMTAFAAFAPAPVLWLLGKKYAGLRYELILIVAAESIGRLTATMYSMNAAKGWVHYSWVEIPIRLVFQAVLLMVIDTSTVPGALYFMMCSQFSPMLFSAGLTIAGFRALRREHSALVPV